MFCNSAIDSVTAGAASHGHRKKKNQDRCILPSVRERHPRPHRKGAANNDTDPPYLCRVSEPCGYNYGLGHLQLADRRWHSRDELKCVAEADRIIISALYDFIYWWNCIKSCDCSNRRRWTDDIQFRVKEWLQMKVYQLHSLVINFSYHLGENNWLNRAWVQHFILALVVLSSLACVAAQCCTGSGTTAAPANTASACTGLWTLVPSCTGGTSCMSYKCTYSGATTYNQMCSTADSMKAAMAVSTALPGYSCSDASSMKGMGNFISFIGATFASMVILKKVQ